MRIIDWSSDVCSSDLRGKVEREGHRLTRPGSQRRQRAHHVAVVQRAAAILATRYRGVVIVVEGDEPDRGCLRRRGARREPRPPAAGIVKGDIDEDRKSTRLNSSH